MEQFEKDPITIDRRFLEAIVAREFETLESTLADDFVLIDLSGALIPKAGFLGNLRSGDLTFDAIQPDDVSVRVYGHTALVTGRTEMKGSFKGVPFVFKSRYTHIYVNHLGHWRMVEAQGTAIAV